MKKVKKLLLYVQPGKQQIKNLEKNKEIHIDGTKKYLSHLPEAYIMSAFK